ncbi:uncharacterized protein LDX57_012979 [Aspergillus melleus]|uniref:uncharacterized protein n=1 Tax=Aspergillus melleus TaxID=138277 RepID=UPI001E8EB136|nr:uncharacterized protein LDX57_012979 [Aspergillus melleus]KAH8435350.1 hypothetical protein LDX57_012979 [Aspergillus melleus]
MTSEDDDARAAALKVLLCGGIAGVATWASVFPLDVIKTRLQAQTIAGQPENRQLLPPRHERRVLNTFQLFREAYRAEGLKVFYRGLGVCSIRAFMVNAVQWATYEWLMKYLNADWTQVPTNVVAKEV